jgi:hypothetical protein
MKIAGNSRLSPSLDRWGATTEQTVCFHFDYGRRVRFDCLKCESMKEPQYRTELRGIPIVLSSRIGWGLRG